MRRKTKFQQNLTIGNTGPPAGGITAEFAASVKRTLKTSRNKINQIRKFPHHQPLPKSSSENFERMKVGKNVLTFCLSTLTYQNGAEYPIIQMSSSPQVPRRLDKKPNLSKISPLVTLVRRPAESRRSLRIRSNGR